MDQEKLKELRDRELFDRAAYAYARKDLVPSTRYLREAIVRRIMNPVLKERGSLGTLVDIGCGIGAQAEFLKGAYHKYIGIDYSTELITIGREIAKDDDDIEFIIANIKDENLPESIADTILLVGGLHHMTEFGKVMGSITRLAKPGAMLVAFEPHRRNPLIQLMRRIRMLVDKHYSSDQQFFSENEIRNIMALAPLKDVRVEYQGFLTPPFSLVVLNPQFVFVPLLRLMAGLERVVERCCVGPLRYLSWNFAAYGQFTKEEPLQ